ncbi:MAG: hypothetical protein KF812_01235 [Fimbriimonadaceae bacterium]|nr:hypothetical protein [Fimbriimonadaceae bacterium]
MPWEVGGEMMTSDVLQLLDFATRNGWVLQFYASIGVAKALPELVRACADHGHDVDLSVTPGVSWEEASMVWRGLGVSLLGASTELVGAEFAATSFSEVKLDFPLSEKLIEAIKEKTTGAKMRTHRQRWREMT